MPVPNLFFERRFRALAIAVALILTSLSARAEALAVAGRTARIRRRSSPGLGFHLGDPLDEVKQAHGPFPYAKQLAPDAVLYADSDRFGYPLVTELYFVGEKLKAIRAHVRQPDDDAGRGGASISSR